MLVAAAAAATPHQLHTNQLNITYLSLSFDNLGSSSSSNSDGDGGDTNLIIRITVIIEKTSMEIVDRGT